MDGRKLEKILQQTGKTELQISELLGMDASRLRKFFSMDDVPTGLIENLSASLHLPVGFFFGTENAGVCSNIVVDRGVTELPFTPLELDLPLNDGEKVRYMAAAIIDDHLELDTYPMERMASFEWPAGKETAFFVFRNEKECLIRHFGKARSSCSSVLMGDAGFHIGMESLPSCKICLYKEGCKVADVPVLELDRFCDALYFIWEEYRQRLLFTTVK